MLILSMTYTMDVSGQFSVLLILSVVGLLLNRIVSLVRRRVLFWDPSEKGTEAPEGELVTPTPLAAPRAAKEGVA
jgi:NitT/TauT family transport system permease protein